MSVELALYAAKSAQAPALLADEEAWDRLEQRAETLHLGTDWRPVERELGHLLSGGTPIAGMATYGRPRLFTVDEVAALARSLGPFRTLESEEDRVRRLIEQVQGYVARGLTMEEVAAESGEQSRLDTLARVAAFVTSLAERGLGLVAALH